MNHVYIDPLTSSLTQTSKSNSANNNVNDMSDEVMSKSYLYQLLVDFGSLSTMPWTTLILVTYNSVRLGAPFA